MERTKRAPFYGWRLLFFLALILVAAGYSFYGPPVLFPMMIQDTGWSRGEIALGATANLLVNGIAAPGVAWSVNRFGARITLFVGGIIAGTGMTLTGLFGSSYLSYVLFFGLVAGLGLSLGTAMPAQAVAIFWFNRRRALAISLVMAGVATGGALASPIITVAVGAAGGNWRVGWLSMALLLGVAAVLAITFVRNRPSDMGQYPDGLTLDQTKAAVNDGRNLGHTYRSPIDWRLADALRTRQFWLLAVSVVGGFLVWQTVVSQGPLHLRDRGFDAATVSLIYGLTVALTVVGRLSTGFLGDRIEPRIIFLIALGLALGGETLFWLASPQTPWATWVYPAFSGIGAGAMIICMPTMVGNYWGPGAFPTINGVLGPLFTIFNSLAGPFAGFIYDTQGSYASALLVAGAGVVMAFGAMLFCTPPRPQQSAVAEETMASSLAP